MNNTRGVKKGMLCLWNLRAFYVYLPNWGPSRALLHFFYQKGNKQREMWIENWQL